MKKVKITYWITTGLVSLMMLMSAYSYLTADALKAAFMHLGYPDYFRVELAVAKLLGVIVLLVPAVPARIKEWAYFGFGITFVSAYIAHVAAGDPVGNSIMPLVTLAVLTVSYFTYHRLQAAGTTAVARN